MLAYAPRGPRQEDWDETRSLFPIYLALAKQLTIEVPIPQDKRNLPENPISLSSLSCKPGSTLWTNRFSSINSATYCR